MPEIFYPIDTPITPDPEIRQIADNLQKYQRAVKSNFDGQTTFPTLPPSDGNTYYLYSLNGVLQWSTDAP